MLPLLLLLLLFDLTRKRLRLQVFFPCLVVRYYRGITFIRLQPGARTEVGREVNERFTNGRRRRDRFGIEITDEITIIVQRKITIALESAQTLDRRFLIPLSRGDSSDAVE